MKCAGGAGTGEFVVGASEVIEADVNVAGFKQAGAGESEEVQFKFG